MTLNSISDQELFDKIRLLSREERRITSEILTLLHEVSRRRLYAKRGHDSLFRFLVKELGYDEASAYRRVSAIQVIESVPEVEQVLEQGKLTVSTVTQAHVFFQREKKRSKPCSIEKKREILKMLEGTSKREAERILARESPEAPKPDRMRAINENASEIRFTADSELLEMLKQLQALTAHHHLEPGYNGLLKFIAAQALKKLDPAKPNERKSLSPVKGAKQHASQTHSRYVPVSVRREVWKKGGGTCAYISPITGIPCGSRHGLELDHVKPWAWYDHKMLRLKSRSLVLSFLCLVTLASIACRSSSAASSDPFDDIKDHYFSKLNLHANESRMKTIPPFAARLTKLAEDEKIKFKDGQLGTSETRERAGLILIYDALMTVNNTNAAAAGQIPLSKLKEAYTFDPHATTDHDEVLARYEHSLEDMELAAKLRPDDRRIDSWVAAEKLDIEKTRIGKIPSNALIASLDAIPARPTFNLWTSMLLFKEEPPDSELFARLAGESKNFVDQVRQGNDPCKSRPRDCRNGNLAPYNVQASVTILADVFLRRAASLYQSGDVPHAMEMASYAKGTYSQLQSTLHAKKTASWPDRPALKDRLQRVSDLLQSHSTKPATEPELQRTENYRRVYECSSCHGR
jgi:hypothetical protein